MGKNTKIEWTGTPQPDGTIKPGHTWNPWQGCRPVSPGCNNCYMYRNKKRYGQDPTKVVRSKTTFNDPLTWMEPAKVFVCSWSDFFIEEADQWRNDAWRIMHACLWLEFLLLTKRPERIAQCLPKHIPPNIRIGVTAENQAMWDKRVPYLGILPAGIKTFVSIEPMLEPIGINYQLSVDWIICGGESGPNCRPMDVNWALLLAEDAEFFNIPFFMKQMSGRAKKEREAIPDYLNIKEWPE